MDVNGSVKHSSESRPANGRGALFTRSLVIVTDWLDNQRMFWHCLAR